MFYIIGIVICVILFLVGLQGFGLWGLILIGIIWACSDRDTSSSTNTSVNSAVERSSGPSGMCDRIYEDGTHRVEKISKTGYYYSDGEESWVGMLGEEHRSNGEVVRENAYIPGKRDIYNENGECIGYEYEDALGITHRCNN